MGVLREGAVGTVRELLGAPVGQTTLDWVAHAICESTVLLGLCVKSFLGF